MSPCAKRQDWLSVCPGGLGIRSLADHSSAAYISSLSCTGFAKPSNNHFLSALNTFNASKSPKEALSVSKTANHPQRQNVLSFKLEDAGFKHLYSNSSTADKAR